MLDFWRSCISLPSPRPFIPFTNALLCSAILSAIKTILHIFLSPSPAADQLGPDQDQHQLQNQDQDQEHDQSSWPTPISAQHGSFGAHSILIATFCRGPFRGIFGF